MTGRWHDKLLKMVATAPFPFQVSIAPSETGTSGLKWELTGVDPATGSSVTHTYLLPGQEQGDYLDLFGKVALSFGTRPPRNRHGERPPAPALPYRVLLDKSVSPDIWY